MGIGLPKGYGFCMSSFGLITAIVHPELLKIGQLGLKTCFWSEAESGYRELSNALPLIKNSEEYYSNHLSGRLHETMF